MKEDKLLILENIKKAIIIQDKKEKKTRQENMQKRASILNMTIHGALGMSILKVLNMDKNLKKIDKNNTKEVEVTDSEEDKSSTSSDSSDSPDSSDEKEN